MFEIQDVLRYLMALIVTLVINLIISELHLVNSNVLIINYQKKEGDLGGLQEMTENVYFVLCNSAKFDGEYHYIFECTYLRSKRHNFTSKDFRKN